MRQLIDGYNLLFQSGLLGTGRAPGFLERARGKLLRALAAALTPDERATTTIVFDAQRALPGIPAEHYFDGLQILFAHNHADADALLEDLIAQSPHPKQLTVVSSDRRIQTAARRRRARTCAARDWFDELRDRPPPQPPAAPPAGEKPDRVSAAQMDEWRAFFDLDATLDSEFEFELSALLEPGEDDSADQAPRQLEVPPPPLETGDALVSSRPAAPPPRAPETPATEGALVMDRLVDPPPPHTPPPHHVRPPTASPPTSHLAPDLPELPDPFPPGYADPL